MKDFGLLLLRLGFGGLMLTHGYPKLIKLINGNLGFADPIGIGEVPTLILAVFAEFVCSILVILGFKVRWSTIPLIATMGVAAFIVHAGDPLKKMEFALLYLVGFLSIFMLNSGKFAIDRFLPFSKK